MDGGAAAAPTAPMTAALGEPQLHGVGGSSSAPAGFIRLRGLPFSAGEGEVKAFFEPQFPLTQVFICKRNGRSNGEAFVQLTDAAQMPAAMAQLNRQNMGTRYVELFEALEGELATAKALTVDRLRGYVIRMRGLPYNASPGDVLRFLSPVEVVRGMEGIIFTWTPDGRPTGEAFVELKDEEAQREAMKKHKEKMSTRYIEIFISTKSALVQAIQHNRLILGFANRKRWLQQAGLSTSMLLHAPAGSQPVHLGQLVAVPQPQLVAAPPPQLVGAGVLGDVTDSLAGMSVAGQPMQLPGFGSYPQLPQAGGLVFPQGGVAGLGLGLGLGAGGATFLGAAMRGPEGLAGGAQVAAYQAGPGGYLQVAPQPAPGPQVLQVAPPAGGAARGFTTLQLGGGQQAVVLQNGPHFQLVNHPAPGGSTQQLVTVDASGGSPYGTAPGSALAAAPGAGGVPALVGVPGAPGPDQLGRSPNPTPVPGQSYLMNPSPGGYTLQTIQLPPGGQLHDYLQLSGTSNLSATPAGGPGPSRHEGSFHGHANLQQALNGQGLAQAQDSGMRVLQQQ